MSRIAAPRRRCSRSKPVDRLGGADVDAARRVDGDDDARLAGQLARQQQLLLVAAGEQSRAGSTGRAS